MSFLPAPLPELSASALVWKETTIAICVPFFRIPKAAQPGAAAPFPPETLLSDVPQPREFPPIQPTSLHSPKGFGVL